MKSSELDKLDEIVEGAIQTTIRVYEGAMVVNDEIKARKIAFEEGTAEYYARTREFGLD